ncbi:PAS domain S-box protein [Microcoleus sp. FACHB-672]|uniref:PAS domain S-box protein n=1 Tax=Microcoleus sp. FACHB-672 TaxID=2692825 RepID=UPI0016859EB3|nr:PAS domain S-box protein [Microcoleus sp. FACHB-672]MBD2041954.1 PAS domain S-box protein [Microcoleus sp. FACHB-672]
MKLRTAFVSSFLGLASLVALLGIINVLLEKNNNSYLLRISQTTIPKILGLEQIKSASSRMIAETLSQALIKSELARTSSNKREAQNLAQYRKEEQAEFAAAQKEMDAWMKRLESLPRDSQSKKLFQELQEYQNIFFQKNKQVIDLKNNRTTNAAILAATKELEETEEEFLDLMDRAIAIEADNLRLAEELSARNVKNALQLNLASIILVTILAIYLGLFLAKKVVQPIIEIKDAAVKIGQGKLDVRLKSKNLTEISILADTFNTMADNLAKITVSQSYFDNVLRSMIDALIVLNHDMTIKTFNFAAFLLLRYDDESDLIGQSLKVILGDDRFLKDLEDSELTQNNSFLGRKETTLLAKNGEKIPVYFSASVLRDDEGQIQGFVCLAQDITDRKRAEMARQESEAKWRSLVENAPDTIITADATGAIQFINRVLPGLTIEEVIGTSIYDCVPLESREQLRQSINSVFETGQPQNCELAWVGSADNYCWYSSRLGPVHNGGKVVAVTLIGSDITDRKRMEEALRESEDRLEGILNSLTDIVWSVSAQTFEMLYVNPAVETVYSRPASEFFQHPSLWQEVVHPEDRERAMLASQQMFTTGLKEIEYRIVRPDGEVRWLHDRGHLTCNADGIPLRLDGIATDITERKRAEEALQKLNEDLEIRVQERTKAFRQANKRLQEEIAERQLVGEALHQSEERLNSILNSLDDVVWSVDATTFQLLYLSSAVETVYGRSVSDFLTNPNIWVDAIHPEDRQRVQNVTHQRFEAGTVELEYRIIHGSGEVRWLRDRSRVVHNAEGKAIRLDGISTDITEGKQAQEALLTSEKHYRAIVEDQTELICRFLPNGSLTFVNDAYCRYFNKQREQLIGDRFMSAIPEREQAIVLKNLKSVSLKNPVLTWENRLVLPNGEIRAQQWTNRAIFDESGDVIEFQAVGRDITQRKRAEAALRKSEARFRNLAKREALLNQLASQIRNSLDLDKILDAAVREIRNLLQIDRCLFIWYRSNAGGSHLRDFSSPNSNFQGQTASWEVVKEARNPEFPSLLGHYPNHPENHYMAKLFNRDMIRVDDLTLSADPEYQQMHTSWGYTSVAIIPIVTLAGEMGWLSCGHCSGPRPWRDSELTLLQAISDQVTIAISQAELYAHATEAARAAREQAQQLQQAMKALQQTQAQLIQTEKMSSLGQMVAGVAHEINNPVSFIYGNVDPAMEYIEDLLNLVELYRQSYPKPLPVIQDEIEAIDLEFLKEDLPKLLSSMKVGAERIRQIVLSLRNFSRLDEAQMKSVDIHEGLDNTLLILQNRLKAKGAMSEIQVVKEYGTLPPVHCFAGQLNQVFMNILANAIDALEMDRKLGNALVMPAIRIHTGLLNGQRVEIRISDNGPGMSQDVKQRVFDPFFTTKPVGAGTGLGLSISYQIVVDKHGGELSCVSAPGEGTEFIIDLPVQQQYHEPALFK